MLLVNLLSSQRDNNQEHFLEKKSLDLKPELFLVSVRSTRIKK